MSRPAGGTRLRRCQRLRSRKDFVRLQRAGARRATRHFVLLRADSWPPEAAGCSARLGITVSRKVGSAVVRNRIKRHIREVFRHQAHSLGSSEDLVLIARRGAGGLTADETRGEILQLLGGGAR